MRSVSSAGTVAGPHGSPGPLTRRAFLESVGAHWAGVALGGTILSAGCSRDASPTDPTGPDAGSLLAADGFWTEVFSAGSTDANGAVMYGIQMMHLVPHGGRLFAGNGTQGETDVLRYPKAAQILVLDGPTGSWRVDKQFSTDSPRVNSLGSFTFATDGSGRAVPPEPVLISAPGSVSRRFRSYARDDRTGEWVATPEIPMVRAPSNVQPRALTQHLDPVTGVDHLFAGVEGEGVFRAHYDPQLPGKLAWHTQPEFVPDDPWQRIVGFARADGRLYLALSSSGDAQFSDSKDLVGHVYERADGLRPEWRRVYTTEPGKAWEDVRGLSAVPDPARPSRELLIFTWNDRVYTLDPQNGFQARTEINVRDEVARSTGLPVLKVVAAYNRFFPFRMPPGGEQVWLVGLAVLVDGARTGAATLGGGWLKDGLYLVRTQRGGMVDYQVRCILRNEPDTPPVTLLAVRDFAVSPFPEDQGQVVYACGLDHQSIPMTRAAWIYRGDFRASSTRTAGAEAGVWSADSVERTDARA